jgi:DNA polymerase-3 subunit alpha
MVYQEDVIKVAHHFAGLDMGEADILRRAMSGKYRGKTEFERIREKFFVNCKALGYPEALSKEVWRQIESFGGYSFSKAHSASFAVESYQSLFLKTHYPMEFMVAVINNFGGFYSTELYIHELKKTGAQVEPPCINSSEHLTTINGKDVHLGFIHIQNLENKMTERILEERNRHGSFLHLQDFIERTAITIEQLNLLIRVGALRFTGKSKKELLWEANFLQKKNKQHVPADQSLFAEPPFEFKLPALSYHKLDDAFDEIELLGYSLGNAFDLVDDHPDQYLLSRQLPEALGREVTVLGYLVTIKYVHTINNQLMHFGTFLDASGDWLDTVHFPEASTRYPFQGNGYYKMNGKVTEEFGVYIVEVNRMEKVGIKRSE